ncbi:hypothetical protein MXB_2208 [Myxobolus squamalis]|nr:hypothetical protein MXB_2208 [Myxobolus squamalis]
MPLYKDLSNPSPQDEIRKHKTKRLVPFPNSYFSEVECANCKKIQTLFSHVSSPVFCVGCSSMIAKPTGGKTKLAKDCKYKRVAY